MRRAGSGTASTGLPGVAAQVSSQASASGVSKTGAKLSAAAT
jgi:hypothetical protein